MSLPENVRTWTGSVDRAGWAPGAWDSEPDKISWTDASTGRPCLIVRQALGALCGYVAVDPGHPHHGKDYDDVDAHAHGGLTYADRCAESDDEGTGICHVPEPGAPEDVWWFGFDCIHGGDLAPGMQMAYLRHGFPDLGGDYYWDVEHVVAQVESLAQQLVAAGER